MGRLLIVRMICRTRAWRRRCGWTGAARPSRHACLLAADRPRRTAVASLREKNSGWSSAAMLLGPEQECARQIRLTGSQRLMCYFLFFAVSRHTPVYARSHTGRVT
jgi:hypothetical protein